MASWSSYQSLIQLGAALNFGFAGFEFLFSRSLNDAATRRTDMVQRMIEERKRGVPRPPITAAKNALFKQRLERLSNFENAHTRWNAMLSVISGILAIAMLGYASFNADCEPTRTGIFLGAVVGYAWFSASILWMLGARWYLRFFVIKLALGGADKRNGKDNLQRHPKT